MIADIAVAAVLLISGVLALFRGFVKETLTIGGWIGAIFITLYGYQHVAPLLKDVVAESWIAEVIAASTLFLISLVVLTVASHLIASKVQGSMLGHLDRALGFVFGLVRGMALISLVYLGATLFWDENNLPEPIQNAKSLPLVKAGADLLASLAPANTFPGRGDPTDQIGGAVDNIKNGVKDAAKGKLNEMIDQMDTEETLRRLNTPEPATAPPPAPPQSNQTQPQTNQTQPPAGQPADPLPAPPGYQDQERQDMQRLIESNQ